MEIFWSQKVKPSKEEMPLQRWFQSLANRLMQGFWGYQEGGPPSRDKMYLTRLKRELTRYEKTGNIEHLRNVCNYAFLETMAPENPLNYDDTNVPSATRNKIRPRG